MNASPLSADCCVNCRRSSLVPLIVLARATAVCRPAVVTASRAPESLALTTLARRIGGESRAAVFGVGNGFFAPALISADGGESRRRASGMLLMRRDVRHSSSVRAPLPLPAPLVVLELAGGRLQSPGTQPGGRTVLGQYTLQHARPAARYGMLSANEAPEFIDAHSADCQPTLIHINKSV